MKTPDDEAWLTALLERRSPPTPDDFAARVLERLPRPERPWRRRLGLAGVWSAAATVSLWSASTLSASAAGASHPVMAFCLGTALLWYLADR